MRKELMKPVFVLGRSGSMSCLEADIIGESHSLIGKQKNIWLESVMGVVVGDALGMPVQFLGREALKKRPIEKMEGYGTYNKPAGTWSDDSSMTLATLISIREKNAIDYEDIMERFTAWALYGEYTPAGETFDQGLTCMEAIYNYAKSKDYRTCGKTGEWANGNGALMRIIPVCLFGYEKELSGEWDVKQVIECIHQVSALTHNHLRSKIACGMYYFMVKNIIEGDSNLTVRLQKGIDEALKFYHGDIANHVELAHYERLFRLDVFSKCPNEDIKSSGYVVDSLEAAVWSLVTTNSFEEALIKAVNLGDDADTVAAIAGGLAALFYGYDNIPKEWLRQIVKREWIESLC